MYKRQLYEQYALGEIDLETYRTRKAVYDTELVQAKNVHAVITAQTKPVSYTHLAAHPLISIFAINSNIEIGGNYYEENQSSGLLPVLYTGHDR